MEDAKGSILIVDDEKLILQVLTRVLQRHGYTVGTAESGRAAVEKTRNQQYDLALIDLKLPDINGVELLKLLNATKPEMKKIVLTGDVVTEEKVQALCKDADAVLMKPCRAEELLKTIDELMQ
jgi:DNA-binding response OmpR family regulator